MTTEQKGLNSLMVSVSDLIAPAGFTYYQDSTDGSWFLDPRDDFIYHLFVNRNAYILSQSDRGQPEQAVFTTSSLGAMELFVTHLLCEGYREEMDLPRLLVVPVPLTPNDVAPGFLLTQQNHIWTLIDESTGSKFFSNHINLVKFSHYSKLSPRQLRDSCLSENGKPPFFIAS
ncbi:Imm61 family immunity protein [Paenarthrobacter sp. NPDC057355]|uniref:Imm61 family immunity protein n=1 Tax=Paenarthrobacter sp. NPDC057355 TaxID=3346105 RepID=UPI00362674CD